jgi:hypothetical protein
VRRRPQPNTRRGLLRAAIVVVVLTAILIGALLVVSSLTAPAVNAPPATSTPGTITPPSTPGPVTPGKSKTPGKSTTPGATPKPTAATTPGATPTGTHKVKKDIALAPSSLLQADEVSAATERARHEAIAAEQWASFFSGRRDAYSGSVLYVRNGRLGRTIRVGVADPFVRPVWSRDHRFLLYVRVRAVHQFPGALWTLLRYDRTASQSIEIAQSRAMGLIPLGWRNGHTLFILSRASDSSVYAATGGHPHFLSVVTTQPLDAATLAPNGRFIAFATPSDCTWCSISVFDISALATWHAAVGSPDQSDFAWTADGSRVVTALEGRIASLAPENREIQLYSWPRGLALSWRPLTVIMSNSEVRLSDPLSGVEYHATSSGA